MKTGIKAIAKKTGLCENTIRSYIDRGFIKGKRDGRGWRKIEDADKAIAKITKMLDGEIQLKDEFQ